MVDDYDQIALNYRAGLALIGLSGKPERDIVELLQSEHAIDPGVRRLLAEALSGTSVGLSLKAANLTKARVARNLRHRIRNLKIGRMALRLSEENGYGYGLAVEEVAMETGVGLKNVEKYRTIARSIDSWISELRMSDPEYYATFKDSDLEVAYLYADLTNRDAKDCVKSSLPYLADLFRSFAETAEKPQIKVAGGLGGLGGHSVVHQK